MNILKLLNHFEHQKLVINFKLPKCLINLLDQNQWSKNQSLKKDIFQLQPFIKKSRYKLKCLGRKKIEHLIQKKRFIRKHFKKDTDNNLYLLIFVGHFFLFWNVGGKNSNTFLE
ncbi:hypothetical protein BpHYR1_036425 [Brachionus plicatilis]|uniref:Uncharacterized protein n=1 Tax=Brachionus plicatilis TaxID=10195 RepID=A0A3M7QCR0_BRAPC|nr:hypothetical protein BpHYR1_036425 [Brachionus plicatilis]